MDILISTASEMYRNNYNNRCHLVMTLNDGRTGTPSCKWLTVETTFYFHPTVQNGNAWFGRGGMWECKPFDEVGDALHTRSVISPGEGKLFLFWVFSLHVVQWLRFLWASVLYKMQLSNSPCKKEATMRQGMQKGANFCTTLLLLYHTSDWFNQQNFR